MAWPATWCCDWFHPTPGHGVRAEAASTVTDGNGAFLFAGIPSGQYVIQAVRVAREPVFLTWTSTRLAGLRPRRPNGVVPMQSTSPRRPDAVGHRSCCSRRQRRDRRPDRLQEGFTISGRFRFTGSRPRPDGPRLQRFLCGRTGRRSRQSAARDAVAIGRRPLHPQRRDSQQNCCASAAHPAGLSCSRSP